MGDRLLVLQQRVIRLAEVTFLYVNRSPKLPWARLISCMISIEVKNKFLNNKFEKVVEIALR